MAVATLSDPSKERQVRSVAGCDGPLHVGALVPPLQRNPWADPLTRVSGAKRVATGFTDNVAVGRPFH
jgi:hypothetical protein